MNGTNQRTYEKYLPIGTVVMLKEGKKRIMITGFCCMGDKEQTKIYDYSGCLYPEGFVSANKFLLFDHNQIDKIYFLGYEDEEEKQFKGRLNTLVEKLNNNPNQQQ